MNWPIFYLEYLSYPYILNVIINKTYPHDTQATRVQIQDQTERAAGTAAREDVRLLPILVQPVRRVEQRSIQRVESGRAQERLVPRNAP